MEVIALGPHDRSKNSLPVDQMYRLRARGFSGRMEHILRRAGLPLRGFDEPAQIGDTVTLAGIVGVAAQSSQRVRPSQYSAFTKLNHAA